MMYRFVTLLLIGLTLSCKKDPYVDPINLSDRQRVLNSLGNDVIIASFLDFQLSIAGLKSKTKIFNEDPVSHGKLNDLKYAWLECALAWKRASLFTFGPIDSLVVLNGIYSSPDTIAISRIISDHSITIDSAYVQGLGRGLTGVLAFEYLLYGSSGGDNNKIIRSFTVEGSQGRKLAYLMALADALQYYSDMAMIRWSRGAENYVQQFIDSDGSDKESSLGVVVHRMAELAALIRKERVGRPYGVFNNGIPQPGTLDGRFSDQSFAMLRAEIDGLNAAYTGIRTGSINAVGIGMLVNIVTNSSGSEPIGPAIEDQLLLIYRKIDSFTTPFSEALVSERDLVGELYDEVEKLENLITNMKEVLRL